MFWIIMDGIHTGCVHKSHQNKIVVYLLNTNMLVVFSIVNYNKCVSIVPKIDEFYQIDNKIQNFGYNSCMDIILSVIDSLCNISCHKLHTNGSDGCELNKNSIVQYTLDDAIAAMNTITKMDDHDVMHYLNLITIIIMAIDTIAHQIEISIATYAIICEASLFIFTHGTCVLVFKWMINHLFYLTTSNMVLICIINAIIAIILQITHTNIILIVVVVRNVVAIHKLDSNRNNVCKFTSVCINICKML